MEGANGESSRMGRARRDAMNSVEGGFERSYDG